MTQELKLDTGTQKGPNIPDADSTSIIPIKKIDTFTSLLIPNFRFLLIGSIFANSIMWIQQMIMSWLVYDITGSGTMLGTVNLVAASSSTFMIPVAGVLVDRLNRRNLMLMDTGWLFTITLLLGLLLVSGHSNLLYIFAFSFMCSMGQSVDMNLRQVLIFDLVPRSLAPNAMALVQTGWSVMRVLGPSIGGFFLIWFGAGGSFLVQAGIYVFIAVTIILIKFPERKVESTQSSLIQNIKDGFQFIKGNRTAQLFMMMGIIMPVLAIPVFAILPPIYAVKVFGDETGKVLGFLMASVGVGGILGGLITASLRRLEHWGRLQLGSLLLLSGSFIVFAFSARLPIALSVMALAGFFEIIFLTTNQTCLQLCIPDKIRGRITALVNLTWILSPLGSLMAGTGADLVGPKNITIMLASTAAALTIIIFLFSPKVRNYRLSQAISSNAKDGEAELATEPIY